MRTNVIIPARKPINASQPIFLRYQKNSIFSIPIATTPAAEPIIKTLPPVPAANAIENAAYPMIDNVLCKVSQNRTSASGTRPASFDKNIEKFLSCYGTR